MWILTSLGRPDRLRAVAEGYFWGTESRVILALYEGDPRLLEYRSHAWPHSWSIETVDMLGNGPTYNEILRRHPREACYGFLADDAILRVQGMLSELEGAAGRWNVAYANDGHHGEALPTMPCMGGDLVRAVGYLSPEYITHWAIDNVWGDIGRGLGALRYFPRLVYDHQHPFFGTAKDDKTYRQARVSSMNYQDIYRSWRINELPRVLDRVRIAQRLAA